MCFLRSCHRISSENRWLRSAVRNPNPSYEQGCISRQGSQKSILNWKAVFIVRYSPLVSTHWNEKMILVSTLMHYLCVVCVPSTVLVIKYARYIQKSAKHRYFPRFLLLRWGYMRRLVTLQSIHGVHDSSASLSHSSSVRVTVLVSAPYQPHICLGIPLRPRPMNTFCQLARGSSSS